MSISLNLSPELVSTLQMLAEIEQISVDEPAQALLNTQISIRTDVKHTQQLTKKN